MLVILHASLAHRAHSTTPHLDAIVYSVGVSQEQNRGRTSRSGTRRDPVGSPRVTPARATPTTSGSVRSRSRRPAVGSGAVLPIMAIFLLFAGSVSAFVAVRLHNRSVDANAVSPFAPATRAIVFVLDGADPSLLGLAAMPNLAALQQIGVTYPGAWIGQMETTAAASAATIGTGSFPRRHGVLGDVWYDSVSGRVTRPTLPSNVLVGSIDSIMEPTGLTSLTGQIKLHRPTARVLSVAGTNCAAAAAAATWSADYVVCAQRQKGQWTPVSVAGHELPASATAALQVRTRAAPQGVLMAELQGWNPGDQDHWIARETVAAMKATRPILTFVTFPEIAVARQSVPPQRAPQVEASMVRGLDADIGRVVRESKREGTYRSTIFVVTSGRAFEPTRTTVPFRRLSNAVVAAGGEAMYLAGDGSALIGLRDPLQAQPVAQAIQAQNSGSVDAVYFRTQAGNSWHYTPQFLNPYLSSAYSRACSYLLSTLASGASPDVVVVYRPFTALEGTRKPVTSTAGAGLAWNIQHVPLIVAGHGVYAGRTSGYPARLVDIVPTLETAMGLPMSSRDGVVLQDALYGDTSSGNLQATEGRILSPLTAALRSRASALAR